MPPSPPYTHATIHSSTPLESNFLPEAQQTQYRHQARIRSQQTQSSVPSRANPHLSHHQLPTSTLEEAPLPSSQSSQAARPGDAAFENSTKPNPPFRLSRPGSRTERGPHPPSGSAAPDSQSTATRGPAAQYDHYNNKGGDPPYSGRAGSRHGRGAGDSGERTKLSLGTLQAHHIQAHAGTAGRVIGTDSGDARSSSSIGNRNVGAGSGVGIGVGTNIGVGDDWGPGLGSYNPHFNQQPLLQERERQPQRSQRAVQPQQQERLIFERESQGSRNRSRSQSQGRGRGHHIHNQGHHRGEPTTYRGTELPGQISSGNSTNTGSSISTSAAGATSLTSTTTTTSSASSSSTSTSTRPTNSNRNNSDTTPTPATISTFTTFSASPSKVSTSNHLPSLSHSVNSVDSTNSVNPVISSKSANFANFANSTHSTHSTHPTHSTNSAHSTNFASGNSIISTTTPPNNPSGRGPPRIGPRSSSLLPPPQRDYIRSKNSSSPSPPSVSASASASASASDSVSATASSRVNAKTDSATTESANKGPGPGFGSGSGSTSSSRPNLAISVPFGLDHDPNPSALTLNQLTESAPPPIPSQTSPAGFDDNLADLTPVSAGFRNLNRWSASTTSTINRSPPLEQEGFHQYRPPYQHHHTASSTSSRRLSIDSIAHLAQQHHHHQLLQLAKHSPRDESPSSSSVAQSIRNSSPRKLAKRRVSSTSSLGGLSPPQLNKAKGQTPPRPSSPPASARPPPRVPAPNLPPIISLPPLDADPASLRSESVSLSTRPQPSPAFGSASGSVVSSRNSADSSHNHSANALADRTETSSPADTRGSTPVLLPAAPVIPGTMRGHVRNKSSTVLGGADSPKAEKRSKPSQKAMLSKALAKANTAVQLDNAQNFDGARKSYIEACELLHQVLARTTGDEDRKKLEAIVSRRLSYFEA